MSGPRDQRSVDLASAVAALHGRKTYAAIAAELGVSKSAVCGIVFRLGLAKLQPVSPAKRDADAALDVLYRARLRQGLQFRQSLYLIMPKA